MMRVNLLAGVVVVGLTGLVPNALGQWSSNPATNFKVSDRSGDQVQPKIARTPDGGAYISWYDNSTGGYDVYLQRVSAQGVEQWAHNGIEIADRGVSSTIDYDLETDFDGNAVIVFADDRTSPQQITLQKVSPAGVLLFNGAAGINVGPGSTTSSPPSLAILADGNYAVIWNTTGVSPVTTSMQKVNSTTGALLWNGGTAIVLADWLSPARPVQASDVIADNAGGVIVLFVRCTGTNCVTSNKQLFSQRYDATGAPQWNAGVPVTIFAGTGSIQTGVFPRMVSDSAGGAIYSYYETGGSRNAYLQHVLVNGTLKFPSPIANTGVTAGRIRISASAAYNPATGEYFLASSDSSSPTQGNYTVIVQKFDSSGNRLWGDGGQALIAQDATLQSSFINVLPVGDGCYVSWIWQNSSGPDNGALYAARVSGGGAPVVNWLSNICTHNTTKSRHVGAISSCGDYAMLAWGNGPSGGSTDISIQNVLLNGTIGPGTCPIFTTAPDAAVRVCPGGTLTLSAAASGLSAPCLRWRKSGVNLANGGRIGGATSMTLTITGFVAADAGTYDCVASNTCGTIPSSAASVTLCAPDYNCDGMVTVADIFAFLAGWFANDPRADFNHMDGVTVADIFAFLTAWFAGCP